MANKRMNMYVEWNQGGDQSATYDILLVDWFCDQPQNGTYWSVHNFSRGYAGFILRNNQRRDLLSIWNDGNNITEIEYLSALSDRTNLTFDNEGVGKHIFNDYVWEDYEWYTTCLAVKEFGDKTYFAKWIKKSSDVDWLLSGIISYPQMYKFDCTSVFQEDFSGGNTTLSNRACYVKNCFGKNSSTGTWVDMGSIKVKSRLYTKSTSDSEWVATDNTTQNCNRFIDLSQSSETYNSVYIASGENYSCAEMPLFRTLSGQSHQTPPVWANLVPRYIETNTSGMYVVPSSSGTGVVIGSVPYYWNFVESSDGYLYILTDDNSMAITLSSAVDETALSLTSYSGNDNQKWRTKATKTGTFVNFVPKLDSSLYMSVRDGYCHEGTIIEVKEEHDYSKMRFNCFNNCELHTIQSNYSSKYVSYTGTNVLQKSTAYEWNFVKTNDGYYYILTRDNTRAITVDQNVNGSDLKLTTYNPGESRQLWKKYSVGNGRFYLISKYCQTRTMDVEGPSSGENAPIQVYSFNDYNVSQFKWILS